MKITQKERAMSKFFTLLVISGFVLLALISVFEFFPLFANYTAFNYQVALQLSREEAIETSAVELADSPSQKQNAISTLEVTVPLFEQEQNTLLQIQNSDDAELVAASNVNYKYIDTAARILLAHSDTPDPIQVNIILQRGQAYRISINQLGLLIVSHSEEADVTQFFIKIIMIVGLFGILIGKYLMYKERMMTTKQSDES